MPRGSRPKANRATFSRAMPRATVAISHEFDPRRTNGRTATRSTGTADMSGQPAVTDSVKERTAPIIMVPPWAKLTVFDTAYVTWKPRAKRPYMLPRPRPVITAEVSMEGPGRFDA